MCFNHVCLPIAKIFSGATMIVYDCWQSSHLLTIGVDIILSWITMISHHHICLSYNPIVCLFSSVWSWDCVLLIDIYGYQAQSLLSSIKKKMVITSALSIINSPANVPYHPNHYPNMILIWLYRLKFYLGLSKWFLL